MKKQSVVALFLALPLIGFAQSDEKQKAMPSAEPVQEQSSGGSTTPDPQQTKERTSSGMEDQKNTGNRAATGSAAGVTGGPAATGGHTGSTNNPSTSPSPTK